MRSVTRPCFSPDRLGSVGHKVQDHLADLAGIRLDAREIRIELEAEGHVLGHGDPEELGHLTHEHQRSMSRMKNLPLPE